MSGEMNSCDGCAACRTYLTPGIHAHDFRRLVLHFLKGEQFLVVALQFLLLQSDHHPPAGGRAGAPQQSHFRGHGFSRERSTCRDQEKAGEVRQWRREFSGFVRRRGSLHADWMNKSHFPLLEHRQRSHAASLIEIVHSLVQPVETGREFRSFQLLTRHEEPLPL